MSRKYGEMDSSRWSPVWCLPQRLQCQSQYKKAFRELTQNTRVTMSAFRCVYVPCVGVVRALYIFPQPLAIVAIIVVLMPLLVMLHAQ